MACMEHHCFKCKRVWMNNEIHKVCPYCKGHDVTNWFDEDVDRGLERSDYDTDNT